MKDSIKVSEDYDCYSDHLYILNPETGDADNELCYYGEGSFEAEMLQGPGWYDYNTNENYSNEPFDVGTGFETSMSGNELSFVSSGEVCTEGYSFDCTGINYGIMINATGRTIKWNQLTVSEGYDCYSDHLYILNAETGDADFELCYYGDGSFEAEMLQGPGWYDYNSNEPFNSVDILPGEGVETFVTGNEVYINFPALEEN